MRIFIGHLRRRRTQGTSCHQHDPVFRHRLARDDRDHPGHSSRLPRYRFRVHRGEVQPREYFPDYEMRLRPGIREDGSILFRGSERSILIFDQLRIIRDRSCLRYALWTKRQQSERRRQLDRKPLILTHEAHCRTRESMKGIQGNSA